MRACVLAIATVAFAQPAFARDHSHKAYKPQQLTRHHHAHGHGLARHHRRPVRVARVREAPIVSGYSMPQSFARTEATDSSFGQAPRPQPSRSIAAPPPGRMARADRGALDGMIARHAAANGLPADLVHRVVMRESRYTPHARGAGGALGLMQIKHATARGVGYTGSAAGLLDAETNLGRPAATRAARSRSMPAATTDAACAWRRLPAGT